MVFQTSLTHSYTIMHPVLQPICKDCTIVSTVCMYDYIQYIRVYLYMIVNIHKCRYSKAAARDNFQRYARERFKVQRSHIMHDKYKL